MSKTLIILLTLVVVSAFRFVQSVGFSSNAGHKAPILYSLSDNALLLAATFIVLLIYLVKLVLSKIKSK